MKLRTIGHKLQPSTRTKIRPPAKQADPIFSDARYHPWRARVIKRAGGKCEWVEEGKRCNREEPRMFADHIVERKDGGAPFEEANGQCLCGSHHTLKTGVERAKRYGLTR